ARRCNGVASGAVCSCSVGVPCLQCGGAPCLPVPCTSNASCTGATGFTSCGQRTSGAFCSGDTTSAVNPCGDLARTIVETGATATVEMIAVPLSTVGVRLRTPNTEYVILTACPPGKLSLIAIANWLPLVVSSSENSGGNASLPSKRYSTFA